MPLYLLDVVLLFYAMYLTVEGYCVFHEGVLESALLYAETQERIVDQCTSPTSIGVLDENPLKFTDISVRKFGNLQN